MPPAAVKSSVSPTVRMAAPFSASSREANPFPLPAADKQNLAPFGLLGVRNPPHRKNPLADFFALHHGVERRTKGIRAGNANANGVTGAGESAWRPFDELGEVVEKRRLHLILIEPTGNGRLGTQLQRGVQQQEQSEEASHSNEP